MSRPVILTFYFISSLVAVYLLHGLVLTSKPEQKKAAQSFDYSLCDPKNPSKEPELPKKIGDTREEVLKKYLLPYVYMDEEFHVPQAAVYFFLNNLSHWDPMITTPFGAYAVSYFFIRPMVFIRSKIMLSSHVPTWATSEVLEKKIQDYLGTPELVIRYITRFIVRRFDLKPADMVTLCRASNGFVATVAVSVLLSAFAKMVLRRVNARLLVPASQDDFKYNEQTEKYEMKQESESALKQLYAARSNILERCKRVLVPAVLQIGFYPTLFFFTALYYTEPMSILFLALMFYCYQNFDRRRMLCWTAIALLGLCSVLVRQTNIVWVAFFAASHLIDVLFGHIDDDGHLLMREATDDEKVSTRGEKKNKKQNYSLSSSIFDILFYTLPVQLPVILLGFGFIGWVIYFNDGAIVVGDKTAHTPTIHFAQIPIMLSFFCLFSPFQTLSALLEFMKTSINVIRGLSSNSDSKSLSRASLSVFILFISLAAGFFAKSSKSMQFHPYLIADNRHYTFYLYRYILKNDLLRTAFCVAGGTCGLLFMLRDTFKCIIVSSSMRLKLRVMLHDVLFLVMCAICVVPQKLIEPRYYLVPAIFHILRSTSNRLRAVTMMKHEREEGEKSIFSSLDRPVVEEAVDGPAMMQTLDVGLNLIIHVGTMHIFLYQPFWAPDGSIGRFLW